METVSPKQQSHLFRKPAATETHTLALGRWWDPVRPEVIVFERKQNCGTSSSRSLAELQSLKLIDFGFNRFEDDEIRGRNTEEDFEECRYCQAPEALCREKLSYKSDIWSVGVIAYVLLSGRLPFRDESDLTSIWGNSVHINFGSTFWKEQVSAEAKDFITQALQLEEENRMDTVQAQQHPWMRKCAKATEGDLQLDPELLKGVADHLVEFAKEPRLKRAALTIIARHAHSEEVTQLRSVFEHFDEDKNGSITRGELHTALRRMHVSNEQIMDIFDSLVRHNTLFSLLLLLLLFGKNTHFVFFLAHPLGL